MKKPNVWTQNNVMKMIGDHGTDILKNNAEADTVIETFTGLPGAYGEFYKTVVANSYDLLIALYCLGRIHGIREERKNGRKAKGAGKN